MNTDCVSCGCVIDEQTGPDTPEDYQEIISDLEKFTETDASALLVGIYHIAKQLSEVKMAIYGVCCELENAKGNNVETIN